MTTQVPETFGERLGRLLKAANLPIPEAARLLGVREGAVYKALRGDTQSLKLDAALRLCKRLGVSPWELAGERESGIPSPALVRDGGIASPGYVEDGVISLAARRAEKMLDAQAALSALPGDAVADDFERQAEASVRADEPTDERLARLERQTSFILPLIRELRTVNGEVGQALQALLPVLRDLAAGRETRDSSRRAAEELGRLAGPGPGGEG